jgi:long-chain acyl-CoA synthetase
LFRGLVGSEMCIRDRIAAVPGVLEVGVIGVPDEKSGEKVQAYVVASAPAPTQEQIIAHCRENLAAYKIPQGVTFVDELPKSPIGKILRRVLRDQVVTGSTKKGA